MRESPACGVEESVQSDVTAQPCLNWGTGWKLLTLAQGGAADSPEQEKTLQETHTELSFNDV